VFVEPPALCMPMPSRLSRSLHEAGAILLMGYQKSMGAWRVVPKSRLRVASESQRTIGGVQGRRPLCPGLAIVSRPHDKRDTPWA
jgi:hypothetical protein